MKPYTIPFIKLSDVEYDRPEKTKTELVQTKKDIYEQLKNYEEIPNEELENIPLNSRVKYLSYDKNNKRELFRFGGLLVKVEKEYAVIVGKNFLRFSAQRYTRNSKNEIIHTTRFFRNCEDIPIINNGLSNTNLNQLNEAIDKSTEIIEKQHAIIQKQKKELLALKKKGEK